MHHQAMLVFFAPDVQFHQMPGKPFTGPLGLGTVRKSTIQAQRAINGEDVHWINPCDHFNLINGLASLDFIVPEIPPSAVRVGVQPALVPKERTKRRRGLSK